MPTYTAYPTATDVLSRLSAVGVSVRDEARLPEILAAVAAETDERTRQVWPKRDSSNVALPIPFDLWEAVACEAARRATREALHSPIGGLVEESYGDEKRKYELPQADALQWEKQYEKAIKRHKKPLDLSKLRGEAA